MNIIIVAEDDFIMSEYLSGILAEKGYSVIAVANADDAIAMLTIGMTFGCSLPILECLDRLTA
jgi:CheY-like chemotaxis protein